MAKRLKKKSVKKLIKKPKGEVKKKPVKKLIKKKRKASLSREEILERASRGTCDKCGEEDTPLWWLDLDEDWLQEGEWVCFDCGDSYFARRGREAKILKQVRDRLGEAPGAKVKVAKIGSKLDGFDFYQPKVESFLKVLENKLGLTS